MAPPLLFLQNIHFTLGGKALLESATLGIEPGERLSLVGRNGSGKSTLLKIAAGILHPDGGERFLQPQSSLYYLPQEPDLSKSPTTLAYIMHDLPPHIGEHEAMAILQDVGLTGQEKTPHLSGGEARRCALVRALVSQPDLLLLDEPTNHLDMTTIEWLEQKLLSLSSAMIVISHDRRLLETITNAVIWIDRGACHRLDDNFRNFEQWRDEKLAQEELEAHKLERKIAREEDWMRYGVTARRKRNVRRVKELADLRTQKREAIKAPQTITFEASLAKTSGKLVIEAEQISKSYDDKPIVSNLTLRLMRGDRLGIVGPNGAGKTTLLNMLTGKLKPDSGKVTLGSSLAMVSLDQQRQSLDPARTLSDTLTGGGGDKVQVGEDSRHVIGYMKDFLFKPEQSRTPVGVLSGGERGRLLLACAMARPSNLLVLDEPTNDLDLETLDLLEDMLANYAGTVLLVSHDRDFLDRVATSILAIDGPGQWVEYAGGYSDMLAQRKGQHYYTSTSSPTPSKNKTPKGEKPSKTSHKLSYKDKHALEMLPGQIAALEDEITQLRAILSDPDLYHKDNKKFQTTSERLTEKETALREAEERWLELEILRDSFEKNE